MATPFSGPFSGLFSGSFSGSSRSLDSAGARGRASEPCPGRVQGLEGLEAWLEQVGSFETLLDAARAWARQRPEDLVFGFVSGNEEGPQLSFARLDRHARAVAFHLQQLDAGGERVLLFDTAGLDFVTCFLGCLYAGAVAVPAYPPRHRRNTGRLQAIIRDARPKVVLTDRQTSGRLSQWLEEGSPAPAVDWCLLEQVDPAAAGGWVPPAIGPDDLAFLQYTSGSTSTPKGVMVSHGNIVANQQHMLRLLGHTPDTVMVSWLPLHHDLGLIGFVLAAIYLGLPCHLLSPVEAIRKPLAWLEAVSRYRATYSGGPNFAFDLCVDRVAGDACEHLDLSSWRVAPNGAEPVRASTLRRFVERFGPHGFDPGSIFPSYGLAEHTLAVTTGPWSGSARIARHELEAGRAREAELAEQAIELVGCGPVGPDRAVVIADPETCRECSDGEVGEIWLAGPSVARGYWGRPEATAATFGARLAGGEGPFLRTGDLGFVRAGRLYVTGRRKDLIIIHGRNIYPQDVEAAIEAASGQLGPAGSAAFSVEAGCEELLVVLAEVRREARHHLDAEALIDDISRGVYAECEVHPAAVILLRPCSIPKTTSGKIQRSRARQMMLDGELAILAEWRAPSLADLGRGSGVGRVAGG